MNTWRGRAGRQIFLPVLAVLALLSASGVALLPCRRSTRFSHAAPRVQCRRRASDTPDAEVAALIDDLQQVMVSNLEQETCPFVRHIDL